MFFVARNMEAQIAIAVHLLNNAAAEDKVHTFSFAGLKDGHLCLGEVDCELMLLVEALQGMQLPLFSIDHSLT